MLSNILDRLSFLTLFVVIVLLPAFFLPFTKIPIETSKGFLLVVGLLLSLILWTVARLSDGRIIIAKSYSLLAGLGIVLAFLISASFSTAPQVSFFGTMFDISSFWFTLAVFLIMFISSILIKREKSAQQVLFGLLISTGIVLLFQTLHIFVPAHLSLGVLASKTDNIIGSWNALGIFAGFFAIMSIFLMEFFTLSQFKKILLGVGALVALFVVVCVGSLVLWGMLGVFSLLVFAYKISFSFNSNPEKKVFPFMSFAMMVICLLFFMSGQFVGGFLPAKLGLNNIEVSPSFTSTMSLTKSVLKKDPVLGLGPNRFGDAWAMYKSQAINSTVFWDTHFDFGSGLIPTLAATTGIVGILSLLLFFFFIFVTGIQSLFFTFRNSTSQIIPAFFFGTAYLFLASFIYPTGVVIYVLAFVFAGIFIGLFNSSIAAGEAVVSFTDNPRNSFFSLLVLVSLMIAACAVGFKYVERFASVPYFGKALAANTVDLAEANIIKANLLYSNDLYLRTYSQVYMLKLNSIVSKGSALTDDDKANLQPNLDKAINGAQLAIGYNKDNYLNYNALGGVFSNVTSLGVTGAYDNAIAAYTQASVLNPFNPGIKLNMAQVSLANKKTKEAKDYATQALTLKPDYEEAMLVLSQIAKVDGDTAGALAYANQALALDPQNKDLIAYVNSLKAGGTSSSASTTPATTDTKTDTKTKTQ